MKGSGRGGQGGKGGVGGGSPTLAAIRGRAPWWPAARDHALHRGGASPLWRCARAQPRPRPRAAAPWAAFALHHAAVALTGVAARCRARTLTRAHLTGVAF